MQQIHASARLSQAWPYFEQIQLVAPQRTRDDPEYDEHVTKLGDGNATVVSFTPNKRPVVDVSFIKQRFDSTTRPAALAFAFDPSVDPSKCAVLAPTNLLVDAWNSAVQDMSPSPARTYVGVSEIDSSEDTRNRDFADDKLEMYNDPAAPLHALTLKVGDVVMLTRNVDKQNGLVANVRVRVVQLRDHTVEVALHSEDANAPPKRFNVCRWRTLFRMSHTSDILIARIQFPFRLAYALTFNKAQGQDLHRVLVDISSNCGALLDKDLHGGAFAHGHLYVALSRVERSSNIAVFVDDATQPTVRAAHIVHSSLLYDQQSKRRYA